MEWWSSGVGELGELGEWVRESLRPVLRLLPDRRPPWLLEFIVLELVSP
jgi:hypothetical protein